MYKIGQNEMVSCPYNRSHVVSKLRIQKHIIKCQSRHPEIKLITCFYNYTHKLKPEDILKHYEICSQKMRMEEARYCDNNAYTSCKSSEVYHNFFCDSINYEKASLFSTRETDSAKSYNTKDSRFKTDSSPDECSNTSGTNDGDNLRPLNLPKTLSKAFVGIKPLKEELKSVPASESVSFAAGGLGRGGKFFVNLPKVRTNEHLEENDAKAGFSKKLKSKSKNLRNSSLDVRNSCNVSVISAFDDGTTVKSDDITFYDDEDEEDEEDEEDKGDANDGFIFKNFDKYVRIEDM